MSSFLNKAARTAKAARALLDDGYYEDAVSRAYYSAFNSAKALIARENPELETKSHGGTLGEFNRLFIKTGLLPKNFGRRINRAQAARLLADYEGDDIGSAEATMHVRFAEELLDCTLALFPTDEHPALSTKTSQEILVDMIGEEAAKKALAHAFIDLARNKGEIVHAGLAFELVLYSTEQELIDLIVNIDDMNELSSYLRTRVTLPSLG
jgi:uncharacterized protein (UPF0332 family)